MIVQAVSEVLMNGGISKRNMCEFQSAHYSVQCDSFMLLSCLDICYS